MQGPVFIFPVLRILNSLSKFFVWQFTHKHSIFVCLCLVFWVEDDRESHRQWRFLIRLNILWGRPIAFDNGSGRVFRHGTFKEETIATVKFREYQEFEDAVKTATSNKVRSALSNSTNQSFTIDEEDTGKSSSTSSSNNASTNARVHTDLSVSVTQKPPSNVDRLRQKPTITRKEQLKCDFDKIELVNKLFPTQKGEGQFNCPWRFINEAENAIGKCARVMLWRGYSHGQQV